MAKSNEAGTEKGPAINAGDWIADDRLQVNICAPKKLFNVGVSIAAAAPRRSKRKGS